MYFLNALIFIICLIIFIMIYPRSELVSTQSTGILSIRQRIYHFLAINIVILLKKVLIIRFPKKNKRFAFPHIKSEQIKSAGIFL